MADVDSSNLPLDPAVISSHAGRVELIGRQHELSFAREELEIAFAGEPRVVLFAGEAGIGKSRLLDEIRRMATDQGAVVAIGRCVDERGFPPYLPWILALSDLSALS